jgi:hypothetical protein
MLLRNLYSGRKVCDPYRAMKLTGNPGHVFFMDQGVRYTKEFDVPEVLSNAEPKAEYPLTGEKFINPPIFAKFTKTNAGMKGCGYLFPQRSPYVFSSNVHNELLSLSNRHMTQKFQPVPIQVFHMEKWVHDNFDTIFPFRMPKQKLTFEQWNKRFPLSARAIHVKAKEDFKKGKLIDFGRMNIRKSFIKREKTLKLDMDGFLGILGDPRMIQGASDYFKVLVSPWLISFSNFLKKSWHIDFPICYTSGVNAEKLGKWFMENFVYGDMQAVCADGSRWDAHVSALMLRLELSIYERFGLPKHIVKLMIDNFYKLGVTKGGIFYGVNGTRASGDPHTSCGNSLINALIHLYVYCISSGKTVPEAFVDFRELVLGDDNAMAMNVHDLKGYQDMSYLFEYLGFNQEIQYFDDPQHMDFCSGRFYPTTDGYVWGPKIGKLLSKVGWFMYEGKPIIKQDMLKSMSLSFLRDVQFIPILSVCMNEMFRLNSSGKLNYIYTRNVDNRPRTGFSHNAGLSMSDFMYSVYGLSPVMVAELEQAMLVEHFPVMISHPYLQLIFKDCD